MNKAYNKIDEDMEEKKLKNYGMSIGEASLLMG